VPAGDCASAERDPCGKGEEDGQSHRTPDANLAAPAAASLLP
jgi:hypothetical protein